ncbi:MAG TPA: bifunctional DNA-formamidopyrimidine glycosylase/DNA-(apurinic or apyrimidinic site) lyase [Tepidisphaeraceae bacterium]|nr:bifunctional DNA-formamidopyrimidine glycosylase/DNA-(apurinic or apyrimidinic site) lyase [Tepidisphaeraceae bacterium]
MPELPEVQTIVNTLAPKLIGQRILRVELPRPDILTPPNTDLQALLTNQTFTRIWRRAKRIMFELSTGNHFYIHLGMSGRLTLEQSNHPLQPHTHLILSTDNLQLRLRDPRRFGGIWWLGTNGHDDPRLGPEPLQMRAADLAKRLSKTTRAIKTALLDQSVIAGLGNIYADEALFVAGINPRRPANKLTQQQIHRLNLAIKSVLRRAIRHRGSTLRDYVDATGGPGAFQKLHRVYDRAGLPCPTCATKIRRITLGGRSTHFCPKCQPAKARGVTE